MLQKIYLISRLSLLCTFFIIQNACNAGFHLKKNDESYLDLVNRSSKTISSCKHWEILSQGKYNLNNDVWGLSNKESGSQCVYTERSKSNFYWEWDWTNNSSHILTFPSITFGHKPWARNTTTQQLPKPVNKLTQVIVNFDFAEYSKSTNNLLLEAWLTDPKDNTENGIRREIGIHFFQNGWQGQAGNKIGKVKIKGVNYDIYYTKPWKSKRAVFNWEYISFIRKKPIGTSANINLDFNDFLKALKKYNLSSDHLIFSSLELGTEVVRGYGNVAITNLNINVN